MYKRYARQETAASDADSAAPSVSRRPASRSAAVPRKEGIYVTIGRRRLVTIERKLAKLAFSLEDVLAGRIPPHADLAQADGLRIRSLPLDRRDVVLANYSGMLMGLVHRYRRHYIAMEGRFEDYLARFSAKSRSTLRRKVRRFADADGGTLDIRDYRGVDGLEEFLRLALPLSDQTYQGRLLKAGLPGDPASRDTMLRRAAEDRVRAFLLLLHGRPVAYLYLPVDERTLIYGHLGYDARVASLSPGSVLQFAALERLFAEECFAFFDFTEGEGQHKSVFATDRVACETLVLLKPTLSNRALLAFHNGFCGALRGGKAVVRRLGVEAKVRKLLHA